MSPLNMGDILDLVKELKKKYTLAEIREMRVYLGDDEELNGVHAGYFVERLDKKDENDRVILNEITDKEAKNKEIILLS